MTAMQTVIDKMNNAKDNFPGMGFSEEFMRGFNKAFQIAIIISKEVGLPKEREQIVDASSIAYAAGVKYQFKSPKKALDFAKQYYSSKYSVPTT